MKANREARIPGGSEVNAKDALYFGDSPDMVLLFFSDLKGEFHDDLRCDKARLRWMRIYRLTFRADKPPALSVERILCSFDKTSESDARFQSRLPPGQ